MAGADDDQLQLDEWTNADAVYGGTGNDGLGIGRGDGKQSISVLASIIYSTTAGIEAVGFAATATLSGTSGADSFDLRGFASFAVGQTITLLAGNDRFLGGADGLAVSGGDGNDSMVAGSNGDALYGDAGNDTLIGGGRDDMLVGGAGRDSMTGGDGSDTYEIDASDIVLETGTYGIDVLLVPYATYTVTGPFEGCGAASGNLKFHGIGSASANMLIGGKGADRLEGLAGDDTLRGGIGHDTLKGGLGNDLYEQTGTDLTIIELGASGNDTIVALGAVG